MRVEAHQYRLSLDVASLRQGEQMVARLGVIAGIVCGQYVPEIGPTTLLATITATIIILICALWLLLIWLAERTSFVILLMLPLVYLAL